MSLLCASLESYGCPGGAGLALQTQDSEQGWIFVRVSGCMNALETGKADGEPQPWLFHTGGEKVIQEAKKEA